MQGSPRLRVAFRTDASIEIGTGHVMRCLTLAAKMRARGAECVFLCRPHKGHLFDLIIDQGFTVLALEGGRDGAQVPVHSTWLRVLWQKDAADSRAVLARYFSSVPVDWLVVDHYGLDAGWERAMRSSCARLMVIDDLADRPHDCDLLLDQNLGHEGRDYDGLVPETCTRLIGPRYALLRPEFAEARAGAMAAREGRGLQRLMISMGGIDGADATSVVLDALRDAPLPEGLAISVIMGRQAPALEKVRALARDMPRPTEVAVGVDDMATRMAAADLAIGAVGTSVLERIYMELPMVCIPIAENQMLFATYLSTQNLASVLEVPQKDGIVLCSDSLWSAMRVAPVIPPGFAASVGSGICDITTYMLGKYEEI